MIYKKNLSEFGSEFIQQELILFQFIEIIIIFHLH
jgi:hypothetical protein